MNVHHRLSSHATQNPFCDVVISKRRLMPIGLFFAGLISAFFGQMTHAQNQQAAPQTPTPQDRAPRQPAQLPADGSFTVTTYNIENWRTHFLAYKLREQKLLPEAEANSELLTQLREANDEDNWEISQVIRDPAVSPHILVFQEGCSQPDLEFFNRRWLDNMFETLIVFPSNTNRGQTVGVMLQPGFKVIDRRDQYYQEPDTTDNPRGEKLFARGPSFILVETPTGYRFWLGTTHQKSKSGNSAEVTAWRNREAIRTYHIMQELRKAGPADVMLLGDFNDELGIQEFEAEGGGDTVSNNLAPAGTPPADSLILKTKSLVESNARSFGGYFRDRGGFIDHVVVTPEMETEVSDASVFISPVSRLASDHYPVTVKVTPKP